MVAGLLCNQLPEIEAGTCSFSDTKYEFKNLEPVLNDWGNY